jgi:uncharacterized integral membrane protein
MPKSGKKSHSRRVPRTRKSAKYDRHAGGVATAIIVVLFVIIFAIAFNWNSFSKVTTILPGIPGDFPTQLVLIILAVIVVLFVYAVVALNGPGVTHVYAHE